MQLGSSGSHLFILWRKEEVRVAYSTFIRDSPPFSNYIGKVYTKICNLQRTAYSSKTPNCSFGRGFWEWSNYLFSFYVLINYWAYRIKAWNLTGSSLDRWAAHLYFVWWRTENSVACTKTIHSGMNNFCKFAQRSAVTSQKHVTNLLTVFTYKLLRAYIINHTELMIYKFLMFSQHFSRLVSMPPSSSILQSSLISTRSIHASNCILLCGFWYHLLIVRALNLS